MERQVYYFDKTFLVNDKLRGSSLSCLSHNNLNVIFSCLQLLIIDWGVCFFFFFLAFGFLGVFSFITQCPDINHCCVLSKMSLCIGPSPIALLSVINFSS